MKTKQTTKQRIAQELIAMDFVTVNYLTKKLRVNEKTVRNRLGEMCQVAPIGKCYYNGNFLAYSVDAKNCSTVARIFDL